MRSHMSTQYLIPLLNGLLIFRLEQLPGQCISVISWLLSLFFVTALQSNPSVLLLQIMLFNGRFSYHYIILLLNVLRVKLSAFCSKNLKYSVESRGSSTYLEWHFCCFSSGRWNSCMMEIEVQFHFSF